MSLVSFIDMDGTFIQTERHVLDSSDTTFVYESERGNKIVTTPEQLKVFKAISKAGIVVPVTARSLESLNKTSSVFNFTSYKICDYGCSVYNPENKMEDVFKNSLHSYVSKYQKELSEIELQLLKLKEAFPEILINTIAYKGINYLIEGTTLSQRLTEVVIYSLRALSIDGMNITYNGRSFIIACGNDSYKHIATTYLMKTKHEFLEAASLGFGDSFSDRQFMKECSFSVVPNFKSTQIVI